MYLHFDDQDRLLYIGKAASIGTRLGSYFQYANDKQQSKPIDSKLMDSKMVRVIALDRDIAFLAPSLEWFLISELNPRVNIQGRTNQKSGHETDLN